MESATGGVGNGEAQERSERACMACRATGNVISHLGGEAKTVTCPWCGGTGVRGAISDAQAKWKDVSDQVADED
jgi:DnaJ-class molecular chaperone